MITLSDAIRAVLNREPLIEDIVDYRVFTSPNSPMSLAMRTPNQKHAWNIYVQGESLMAANMRRYTSDKGGFFYARTMIEEALLEVAAEMGLNAVASMMIPHSDKEVAVHAERGDYEQVEASELWVKALNA